MLDSTKMPKKAIQGAAWYSIYSNQEYADLFNYIGPHIKEREKLIEDGYKVVKVKDPVENKKVISDGCKLRRWGQSDMVAVMLSLSYIPDNVVQAVDFSKVNWNAQLKAEMIKHQKQWEKDHEMTWQDQTNEVENDYKEFIKKRKDDGYDTEYLTDMGEENVKVAMKDFMK